MPDELDVIRHALQVARERGMSEVEIEFGGVEFEAKLVPALSQCFDVPAEPVAMSAEPASDLVAVTSPVVGFFREAAKPIKSGARVEKGTVVGVVAALGLANEVESPVEGEVVELLVQADQAVEFGQALAMVRKG